MLRLFILLLPSLAMVCRGAPVDPGAEAGFFQFRMPGGAAYRVERKALQAWGSGAKPAAWIEAREANGSTNRVRLGSRVVLQAKPGVDWQKLVAGRPLTLARTVLSNVVVLQAADAPGAAREAARLATLPGVLASYPVMQEEFAFNGPYARQPNDPYVFFQWYLEHRNADGTSAGVDLNARAAWPFTRGEGVTIAVGDVGVQLSHPELTNRATGGPHFNFAQGTADGTPFGLDGSWAHGTEVAGLAVAEGNNGIGMCGVAPQSHLASWVIAATNGMLATDEQLMDLFQYQSNSVAVQTHSWGTTGLTQNGPGVLQQIGISNAVTQGRSGKGVVIVRAAGNDRVNGGNADDDSYPSDPRVIAVGAVRIDGRVASYSDPGACLLVGAPSGDTGLDGLFTTDLTGTDGVNNINFFPPNQSLNDYVFNAQGLSGTSAATPQIAGIAALVLSANPNLAYRDVQQILIFASRHFDFADPDLRTNGAGFIVSHNLGFGVPDAGAAVALARRWVNRPAQTSVTVTSTDTAAIPDAGLRVLVTGTNLPPSLSSIVCAPGVGPHPDSPTALLPLVDVGQAATNITISLTNRGALIQRGLPFAFVINRVAAAGAAFAIIYNVAAITNACPGGETLCPMGSTDFVPIPAVFMGESGGEGLSSFLQTNSSALAQIALNPANYVFTVTNTLVCEQVGVRLQTDHPSRGDLRVTLVSPQGTRSVLQRLGLDLTPGPADWTYYSTHHFYESSAGDWRLEISDEYPGGTGNVLGASLTIFGVPITDTDHDGLDDDWELAHFGSLAYGPADDPDRDGCNNAREQVLGTDPMKPDAPFTLDLSPWNSSIHRLSWPGNANYTYEIRAGGDSSFLTVVTNVSGVFPETEWFTPDAGQPSRFFRVRAVPKP